MNSKITALLVILLAGAVAFIASQQINKNNQPSPQSTNTASKSSTHDKQPAGGTSEDLSGKQLTAIPTDILNRTDITTLNLSNNQLTSLPSQIGGMSGLTSLNVENNRLESLPADIAKLKNLETLDVGNNRINSLPSELGDMTWLKSINLSGYKGSPSDIENLKSKLTSTQIKT